MIRSLTLILLAVAVSATAADKDDPGGWTKAKWSMTQAEISQAFDGAVPDQVELAHAKFHVIMRSDKDGKLNSVILEPAKGETQNSYLYEAVQDLLVQKYGRPWKSDAAQTTDLQWTFPTTVITLTFTSMPAMDFYIITLHYAYRPPAPI